MRIKEDRNIYKRVLNWSDCAPWGHLTVSGNIFGCQKLWNVTGIQWVEAKNAAQDSPTTKNGLAHSVKSLEVENHCYKHGLVGGREEWKEGRSRELGTSRERKQKRMILVGCSTPTPDIVYRKLSVGLHYD